MTASYLRPDLSPMPNRIYDLPRFRGYPVPWFVAWLLDGKLADPGATGAEAEFRVTKPGAAYKAYRNDLCWICGHPLTAGSERAFVIGPMCAVNHNTAEPPSHVECAEWSAVNCPFLARPHATRRDNAMPSGLVEPAGIALMRNPGVALVWIVERYWVRYLDPFSGDGMLFDIGDPTRIAWYAEGREATRAEVEASLDSGLPALRDLAEQQGPGALEHLDRSMDRARELLPA